jgi:hypothetical protein
MEPPRYIFLMRHAKHKEGRLDSDAVESVRAVGGRFAEWLDGELRGHYTHTLEMWCTNAPEVRETARQLSHSSASTLSRLRTERLRTATGRAEGLKPPEEFRWPEITGLEEPGTPSDGNGDGSETKSWIVRGRLSPEVELKLFRDRDHDASSSGDDTEQRPPGTITPTGDVDPRKLGAYAPDREEVRKLVKDMRKRRKFGEQTSVFFVGNDPLVGWLASELTGSRRGLAIARGEMLCLTQRRWPLRWRWRLSWNIAGEQADLNEITSKIQSKMDTAKTLGAVITALATFVLTQGFSRGSTWWLWGALACLAAAGMLFFFTLFFYDTLLMPSRYWGGRLRGRILSGQVSSVQRPPGSTDRVLHDAMVRIWVRIFTPAAWLAGIGVLLLAGHAAESSSTVRSQGDGRDTPNATPSTVPDSSAQASAIWLDVDPWHVIIVALGLLAVFGTWAWLNRPRLGVSD